MASHTTATSVVWLPQIFIKFHHYKTTIHSFPCCIFHSKSLKPYLKKNQVYCFHVNFRFPKTFPPYGRMIMLFNLTSASFRRAYHCFPFHPSLWLHKLNSSLFSCISVYCFLKKYIFYYVSNLNLSDMSLSPRIC